jgi:hypothetical protein
VTGIRLQLRKIPETLRLAGTDRQIQAASAVSGVCSSTCPQHPHPMTDNSAPAHLRTNIQVSRLSQRCTSRLRHSATQATPHTCTKQHGVTHYNKATLSTPLFAVRAACPAHLPNYMNSRKPAVLRHRHYKSPLNAMSRRFQRF